MNQMLRAKSRNPWNRFPLSYHWNEWPSFSRSSNIRDVSNAGAPAVDITETDSEYQVVADLPGVAKDDLEVSVKNDILSIIVNSEDVNEEKSEGRVLRRERFQGRISRSFRLGDSVDNENIQAHYKDGVLSVTVPKKESLQSRRIEVAIH